MKKKYSSFTECLDLREVKTLRDLSHPHIVRLLEVIRENDSTLCFVFEHMDANLYEVMKQYQNSFNLQAMGGAAAASASNLPVMSSTGLTIIPTSKIQSILFQVLQALTFMHSKGYFHRDIKPENLLMKGDVVKVADLGLAREILSLPPYTDYVSTRWYRAPEVLLRSPNYNAPIGTYALKSSLNLCGV
jgi:serine/threonine protein kinase